MNEGPLLSPLRQLPGAVARGPATTLPGSLAIAARLTDHGHSALGDIEVVGNLAYVAGGSGLRIIDFGPEYAPSIEVDVDIKPGSDTNAINLDTGGELPVAILGSGSFDVADVDGMTLAFGPGGAAPGRTSRPGYQRHALGANRLRSRQAGTPSGVVRGSLIGPR